MSIESATIFKPEPTHEHIHEHSEFPNLGAIAGNMAQILRALGLDLDNEPGIQDTPMRFAKYLAEFMQKHDYAKILGTKFPVGKHQDLIAQTNIPFRMVCEHHLLPAIGVAAIGYIPNQSIVGLSKLTRLVQAVGTERPSLQEVICDRISGILSEHVAPKGVITIVKAEHGCMACRGVNTPGIPTVTSSVHGIFRDVIAARQEFFNLVQIGGMR